MTLKDNQLMLRGCSHFLRMYFLVELLELMTEVVQSE